MLAGACLRKTLADRMGETMNEAAAFAEKYVKAYKPDASCWKEEAGYMLSACVELYGAAKDTAARELVLSYLASSVSAKGELPGLQDGSHDLAAASCGKALFFAWDETGDERYRKAADRLAERLKTQPRCPCGNFWRKDTYPDQVRLDALYFCQSFRVEHDMRLGDKRMAKDVALQFQNARKYLFDEEAGLYRPARNLKAHGLTHPEPFTLSSVGQLLMALADCVEKMDMQLYEHYRALVDLFREAVFGLLPYAGKETGLFSAAITHQSSENAAAGNAMVIGALLKGIRLGLLDEEKYLPSVRRAFELLTVRWPWDQETKAEWAGPYLMALAEYRRG